MLPGGARRVNSLFILNTMYLELRFALAGMPLSENSSESEAPDYGGGLAEGDEAWWPQRVTDALKAASNFGEYKKKRISLCSSTFSQQRMTPLRPLS